MKARLQAMKDRVKRLIYVESESRRKEWRGNIKVIMAEIFPELVKETVSFLPQCNKLP